jgi:hypothetical protein
MVQNPYNPALGRLRKEAHKFEARLGYTAKPYLKRNNKKKKQLLTTY